MISNTDVTLYHRTRNGAASSDTWTRTYLSFDGSPGSGAWWYTSSSGSITNDGYKTAETNTIRIWDTSLDIAIDDVIIKGECAIEMTTIKDLKGVPYKKVVGANPNFWGASPHWKVVAI